MRNTLALTALVALALSCAPRDAAPPEDADAPEAAGQQTGATPDQPSAAYLGRWEADNGSDNIELLADGTYAHLMPGTKVTGSYDPVDATTVTFPRGIPYDRASVVDGTLECTRRGEVITMRRVAYVDGKRQYVD